jgi:predicted transcriptional regulator
VLGVGADQDVGEVVRRLDAGDTVKAIAAELGVTERTIRNRLHAAGLPLASDRGRDRRRALLADPVWLRERYVAENEPTWSIANRLGVETTAVSDALDRFGIARPPSRPELSGDALRAAFCAGESVKSIARAVGVDRATVRREMRRHGVVNPLAGRGRRPAELDDPDWLRGRYTTRRMTIQAIADEVGVTQATVSRALTRHAIDRRRGNWQPRVHLDPAWLRVRFEVDRAPIATIAAEVKANRETIARAVRRLGLERSSYTPAPRRPHPHADRPGGIDPTWLRKRYIDDGFTMAKIAREAGVGPTTVHRALRFYGLDRRSQAAGVTAARTRRVSFSSP